MRVREYQNAVGDLKAFLPAEEVRRSLTFKENVEWVQGLKEEGYTVIDVGNPNGLLEKSPFYEVEVETLFGR